MTPLLQLVHIHNTAIFMYVDIKMININNSDVEREIENVHTSSVVESKISFSIVKIDDCFAKARQLSIPPTSFNKCFIYYIPSSKILKFPSVINFDIITRDDINFHFHFLP